VGWVCWFLSVFCDFGCLVACVVLFSFRFSVRVVVVLVFLLGVSGFVFGVWLCDFGGLV